MSYPKSTIVHPEIDLKLGIKSSLPNAMQAIVLAYLIWNCSGKKDKIAYSTQNGDGLILNDALLSKINNLFSNKISQFDRNLLNNNILENPLLKAQIEALIVGFELIWKLARFQFVNGSSFSVERIGGKRFEKIISYTSNIDILEVLVQQDEQAYINLFYEILTNTTISNQKAFDSFTKLLTVFSESAIYKIEPSEEGLLFNNLGIYQSLIESDTVDLNGNKENKGSSRILKSSISEGLNYYLKETGTGYTIKNGIDRDTLKAYAARVDNFHAISNISLSLLKNSSIPEKLQPIDEAEIILLFIRFMSQQKRLKSAEKYAKDFSRWSAKLVENEVIPKGVYQYTTVEEYEPIISVIKGSEIYQSHYSHRKSVNPKSGLEIDAELSNYLEFLHSDYLENKTDTTKYSDRTIGTPLILYGPPGTGKTHEMQTKYCAPYKDCSEDLFITTFHQSFSYEEFVEGLKPVLSDNSSSENVEYQIEHGIFYQACEQAALLSGYTSLDECIEDAEENRKQKIKAAIDGKKVVLLCIDEINRANVSSVFGDLISLVESSKRLGAEYEMTAKLPYSKKDFGVPANLMIIGTMNTADRSIQLLDSALRRRFKFEELLPQYDAITNTTAKSILKNINNRIRALLDKDHQIGHSYFIGVDSNLKILEVMKENIIPLLEEYFYNETDKIRRVLNETEELKDENSHLDDYFYVLDMDAKNAVKDTDDFNEEKPYYKLNDKLKSIKDEESATTILAHLE
ncbi:MAG: AAA family ATPase [Treponema sp.]|nr:AAA family ATPase [Treponema sp.]